MSNSYSSIPAELKALRQWTLAGSDDTGKLKKPCGVRGVVKFDVSPKNPAHWSSYHQVETFLDTNDGYGLGFMLSDSDPFTCIDLDVKNVHNEPDPEKWTSPEQLARFRKIVKMFNSYTELSGGGQGIHIWVRGSIGAGLKVDGVEVYSRERFIVCTGKALNPVPIQERQELLSVLVAEMHERRPKTTSNLIELEELETDDTILARAETAQNSEKYKKLFAGDWDTTYPSQSEADYALLSMYAFYTQSNEQVRRLFRMSQLGKRDKHVKGNYHIDVALRGIRGRQGLEVAGIDDFLARLATQNAGAIVPPPTRESVAASLQPHPVALPQAKPQAQLIAPLIQSENLTIEEILSGEVMHPDTALLAEGIANDFQLQFDSIHGDCPWPPGFLGELSKYFYEVSPKQIRQTAVFAALAAAAGICGLSYNYAGSGLNLYLVFVAPSASGKNSMNRNLMRLVEATRGMIDKKDPEFFLNGYPRFEVPDYIPPEDSDDYSYEERIELTVRKRPQREQASPMKPFYRKSTLKSAEALTRILSENPSFVFYWEEFGNAFRTDSSSGATVASSAFTSISTRMLSLYEDAAYGSRSNGEERADSEKSTTIDRAVNFSVLAETVPADFFNGISQASTSGLMSRLISYVHEDKVPKTNRTRYSLPHNCAEWIAAICNLAEPIVLSEELPVCVTATAAAKAAFLKFADICNDKVNACGTNGESELERQLWGRADRNVERVAALCAAMSNPIEPQITIDDYNWAAAFVLSGIATILDRSRRGDIIKNDDSRRRKMIAGLGQVFSTQENLFGRYISDQCFEEGIVSISLIRQLVSGAPAFANSGRGLNANVRETIKILESEGILIPIARGVGMTRYGVAAELFIVDKKLLFRA